jgi:hypothetical protein
MARAYGWNAQLLLAEETEYGEMPANNYRKIPFISTTLDSEQNLVSSNVLGLGRDPTQPFQDVINVDGDMVVPVDMRNIGVWLKAIFGIPSTEDVDDGVYTHSFESGKIVIPSYTLEVGLPEVPQFIRFMGVRANSIAFNFQRSGEAQVTLNLIGQGESGETTAIDTNPEVYKYTRVSQFQGFIKSNGALLANITAASATYSNNLEKIETIRNDGKVEAIDLGVASLSGSISARYGDNILLDKARAGTPVDIELGYQLSDNLKLEIVCHEVYLPKPKRTIDGPNGIECSYDFQGAKNEEIGRMMTVKLTNDVESY